MNAKSIDIVNADESGDDVGSCSEAEKVELSRKSLIDLTEWVSNALANVVHTSTKKRLKGLHRANLMLRKKLLRVRIIFRKV